jgi:predicted DNA-binding transcriptional regulator YafY
MSKAKLLSVLEVLKKTDEEHPLTIGEIIGKLRLYGLEAERKSISRDIQALNDSGYSVLSAGKREGYYLAEREFDDYELVMIFAAIARAKFITEKDSRIIQKKLKSIAPPGMEKLLSDMVADGAVKTDNAGAKYAIDKITHAIRDDKKLCFQYFEYGEDAKKRLRRNGHIYTVSPFYLAWVKEELYLIANPDSHAYLTHFKVAMLTKVDISDEQRKSRDEITELAGRFDLNKYVRESIDMYSGEAVTVTARCHNSILTEVINRFGESAISHTTDGNWRLITIRAADNEGLYRWAMQYGDRVEVISPESAREAIKQKLAAALEIYR